MIKASIIIPRYNQLDYTKQCITFLEKCTDLSDVEIIIIDNGSTDGTKEYFKNKYTYLRNNE
ncbi:glycosyltransferase, partial [bacterium]|nr:glycosyltransferase [bacterium]